MTVLGAETATEKQWRTGALAHWRTFSSAQYTRHNHLWKSEIQKVTEVHYFYFGGMHQQEKGLNKIMSVCMNTSKVATLRPIGYLHRSGLEGLITASPPVWLHDPCAAQSGIVAQL